MTVTKRHSLGFALFLIGLCYVSPAISVAQTNKPPEPTAKDRDQTLQQLLNEVHELRLVMQRATANTTRFQMLLERARVQQAHVDVLSRQLENIRSQIAEMKAAKPQLEQQVKDAEDLLDRTPEPNAHAEVESRIKATKSNLTRLAQEDERLRARESILDTELQTEQSKLNDLNSQLDALMNDMKAP